MSRLHRRGLALLSAVILLPIALVPPSGHAQGADPCADGNDPVWFLAIVYDAARRNDFQLDVDNFEFFLSELRQVYCIPDTQAEILAFNDAYTRYGKTYADATEANLKSRLAGYATATASAQDPLFFFFLSSHGNVYALLGCPGGQRVLGSFSALRSGGGQDGRFNDCELGVALNAFPASTRMVVMADCSFCGGFSDSLTAASGTLPDGRTTVPSGILASNRIVITGCAVTTECFGGARGAVLYGHLRSALERGQLADGWTAPSFPDVQGIDLPLPIGPKDGTVTATEWFWYGVFLAYSSIDPIAIQEQFRIKYGFPDLASDIAVS